MSKVVKAAVKENTAKFERERERERVDGLRESFEGLWGIIFIITGGKSDGDKG